MTSVIHPVGIGKGKNATDEWAMRKKKKVVCHALHLRIVIVIDVGGVRSGADAVNGVAAKIPDAIYESVWAKIGRCMKVRRLSGLAAKTKKVYREESRRGVHVPS